METQQGRQRIDYAEAEQLLRAGWTQQQVADRYSVTQAAVSLAIRRGRIKGIEYDRVEREASGVPWSPLEPDHQRHYYAIMLRAAARRDQGFPSTPVSDARLDAFLASLEERNAVVHYDPETGQGFFLVPRRDGIDHWWVRDPYVDDDGNKIRSPQGVMKTPPVWLRAAS